VTNQAHVEELAGCLPSLIGGQGFAAGCRLRLDGNTPPWQSTGLELTAGQHYSLFAGGRISWSPRHAQLYGGPRFHLWARISPGGRTVNLAADSGTFIADCDGILELGIYMGVWADEFGRLASSTDLYRDLGGSIDVVAATYVAEAAPVLAGICRGSSPPAAIVAEAERYAKHYSPPTGWQYLRDCGFAEIYTRRTSAAGPVIDANASDDQGILRHPVDFPLTPETVISWRWRLDEHPSTTREDRAMTHDYVSVATEFDNGRDLTWIWSSTLARGEHFACPVKVWSARETHYVVRTGEDRLGTWYDEARHVQADVMESMGPPPLRITAVWLIAVSTFQHRRARASFAGISLANGSESVTVL
jgi:hypothetical protein